MSDFDKEAERERLREKYERDREKREATQRMSELLLQGATMTNKHCGVCGDPLFRYDGQEFCASGHGEEEAPGADATGAEAADAVSGPADAADAATAGANGRAPEGGADRGPGSAGTDDGVTADETGAATDETGAPTGQRETGGATARPETERSTAAPTRGDAAADRATGGRTGRSPGAVGSGTRPAAAADLDEARASLVRTLGRMAAVAEECDDPRRAREYLSAAREAAEAVAALDR